MYHPQISSVPSTISARSEQCWRICKHEDRSSRTTHNRKYSTGGISWEINTSV